MHVSNAPALYDSRTYAEHFNLNRPYVWLPWCQKVLRLVGLLQSHSYTVRCVPLHDDFLGLQQLQLLERYVVGDAGGKPAIAHCGRVEGNV